MNQVNGYRLANSLWYWLPNTAWNISFGVFGEQSLGSSECITECSNLDALTDELFHIHSHHRIWTAHIVHDKKSLLIVSVSICKTILRMTFSVESQRMPKKVIMCISWKLSFAPFWWANRALAVKLHSPRCTIAFYAFW